MKFDELRDFLDDELKFRHIPGQECLIYHNNDKVFDYCEGMADIETGSPLKRDSIFRMYSMTKVITCVAALQLFEKGRFLMTDPVYEYLPEFSTMTVARLMDNGIYEIVPARETLRVQHLFNMTSGLCYPQDLSYTGRMLGLLMDDPQNSNLSTLEMVRKFAGVPLLFEPGTRWKYGLSHDVLGGLIEAVSGKRFSDYLQENIFDPLEMKDTFFHFTQERKERLVSLYAFDEGSGELQRYEDDKDGAFESGGAGLKSTVPDYMKFANALCHFGVSPDGVRILGRRTVEMMRMNCLSAEQQKCFDWVHMKGYGYGFGVRTMAFPEMGSNSTIGEFGWAGLAGTDLVIEPEEQLTMVYAQQRIPNDEPYLHPRLRNMVNACLD